jgi:hypothetical protein
VSEKSCNYAGAPSLAWDAMLLMIDVELDLLKDSHVYLFFERGIRGGQSVIFHKYTEANIVYFLFLQEQIKGIIINIWKIMMKIWIIPLCLI